MFCRKLVTFESRQSVAPNFQEKGKKETRKRDRERKEKTHTQKIDVNLVDGCFIHFARVDNILLQLFDLVSKRFTCYNSRFGPAFAHGSIVRALCLNESVRRVYERVIAVTKTICQFASFC